MGGDGAGQLPHQMAEFVDLALHRQDAVLVRRIGRYQLALDGGQPAAEFGDLAGQIGGAV